jgi:hypothetical protein
MNTAKIKKMIGDDGPVRLDDLFRIVDLMKVPSENRWRAALHVHFAACNFGSRRGRPDRPVPYKRIAIAATKLLQLLNDRDCSSLIDYDDDDVDMDIHRYIDLTEALRDNAELLTPRRQANRPPGSFKNKPLQHLIRDLYRIAEESQGRITYSFDRTRERTTGTLLTLLEIFRPHFPGKIPAKIPYSTMQRMRLAALAELQQSKKSSVARS